MPTPASYRGMPAARFWEFEQGDVDYGALETGREDLTRLLLTEFALIYGNDFFVLPLDLQIGALCRIRSLELTDTFGGRWDIPSIEDVDTAAAATQDDAFHLFRLTGDADPHGVFLVAPTLTSRLTGPPLEEVALIRDDTAAAAWGIERIVLGPGGRPIRRRESEAELRERNRATQREQGTTSIINPAGPLVYRLAELPPANWIPLVPVQKTGSNTIDLQVRALLDDQTPPQPIEPFGQILHNGDIIRDEEIPRTGVSIVRAYRMARWRGGSTLLWIGRARRLTHDEGPSGLRYDVAE
jgi:hypothetical protein